MNPLFEEHSLETTEASESHPHRRPKSLSDDGSSSSFENPSSSSGYESVAAADKFRIPETSRSAQNDYRRQFHQRNQNPGFRNSRIGPAGSLIHYNPQFVSHIQIRRGLKNSGRRMLPRLPEDESGWDITDSPPHSNFRPIIPEPIWPMSNRIASPGYKTLPHPIIPYIHEIVDFDADRFSGKSNRLDPSFHGDSLVVWANDVDMWDSLPQTYPELNPPVEESIGQLSQTLSQSHTLRAVSRALNSKSTNQSYNGSIQQKSNLAASSVSLKTKNRWKNLIFEDRADPVLGYHTLNHEYVPKNGDLNFRSATLGNQKPMTFSSLAEVRMITASEAKSRRLDTSFRMDRLYFETDSLRSSSRSSSSSARRVTFSADTVDNEPSIRSSISSITSFSELKLNPQDLIQKKSAAVDPTEFHTHRLYVDVDGSGAHHQQLDHR